MPRIGILANPHKSGASQTLCALRERLAARGCTVVLDTQAAELLGQTDGIPAAEMATCIDMAAVLGGDGTVLDAMARLGPFDKPVAGVNTGRLGFLTTCTEDELDAFALAVTTGRYTISPRSLLEAVVHRGGRPCERFTALNDMVLARGETGRLVSVTARVDGDLLNHYRADGLIVATPTGSTAYSLSAGGPLVTPSAGVFVITPICPHSLSQRSLVLDDDSVVEIAPDGGEPGPLIFTVDGRDITRLDTGDVIEIRKSARRLRLLRLEGHSFYQALRQKLRWLG